MTESARSRRERTVQLDAPASYAVAVGAVAAAWAIDAAFGAAVGGAAFELFTLAVLVASWLGGLGPGLLATAVAAIAGAWAIAFPNAALHVDDPHAAGELLLFVLEGGLISWVGGRMRAVRRERDAVEVRRVAVSDAEGDRARLAERADDALAQLEELYREAPVGLCQIDRAYRWVRINERLAAINGYPVEAHLGKSVRELLPDIADEAERAFARIFETGEPIVDYELTGETPAHPGVRRTFLESWYPLRNARGDVTGINVVCREVTEQKRAAAALAASEERFRLAAEAVNGIIYDYDFRTGRVDRTRGLLEVLGHRPEDVPPTHAWWWAQIHPDDRAALPEKPPAAAADGRLVSEYRVRHRDGRWLHVVDRGVLTRDANGEPLRLVGCTQDVTEQRAIEAALRDADRRKDEFLAMLAHELRNPLAPIRNAVSVFRAAGVRDPLHRRSVEIIDRQVRQMTRLVDDLLDVSRIARGLFTLQRERVRLAEILELAVETARPLTEVGMHTLTVTQPDAPLELYGDRARLVQVVGNLLANAAKFTPRGGHVWLEAAREGDRAVVRVRDDGIGFDPDVADRLFGLFAQEDDPLARSHGGLGIGLALVRQIVEMHGGRVAAASAGRGRGAEFRIELTVAAAQQPADDPHASAAKPPGETGRRVLIVEDNPDAAESLRMLIALHGHQAHVAQTGSEALRAFDAFEPEVAFVDLGLPDIDGFEVARRMRTQPGGADCVLVALSGYGREDDRRRARDAGFDHHVTKPIERETMCDLLRGTAASDELRTIH